MSGIGRVAAVGAVVAAIVVVGFIIFGAGGAGGYSVKAKFINAGQLVPGNLVQIGGTQAGTVGDISLTDDGQAVVEMKIDDLYAPLRRGTKAVIRQASLSGIANRYIELELPPGTETDTIREGATLGTDQTVTPVELDQLFNTFDPETRTALQEFFKGSAKQYQGRGKQANLGYQYLNPALSSSSRLFNELNRDTPVLERFLIDSAKLVTALAERRDDLAGLIRNLNVTMRAIGNEKVALAEAIRRLPDFFRTSNTTFVNLRAALDDVDPLVDASKPVARKLRPFLAELRPFARDARPTVRDLSRLVRQRGRDNDLIELTNSFPPLADIALTTRDRTVRPGGTPYRVQDRRGAFPEITDAMIGSAPIIAYGRPYTPDLFGWFDDFSNTGVYDATGGISRTQGNFNVFTPTGGLPLPQSITINPGQLNPLTGVRLPTGAAPVPIPAGTPLPGGVAIDLAGLDRGQIFRQFAKTKQYRRCPGGADLAARDGTNVFSVEEQQQLVPPPPGVSYPGPDCRERDRAVGPVSTRPSAP